MNATDATNARPADQPLQDLLRAHQDAVYNVCWQILRQEQDAQDAAQQVLMKLVRDLPGIVDQEHLRRWIYRASFQVALDVRKMRGRRMKHERNARTAGNDAQTVDMVHEHVAALDDDLRAIVAEHYFEQRPLEALAQARGCSTTAVWKKLERAKERLRESISRAGFALALPDLDRLLTSHRRVPAPKGLLTAGMMATSPTIGGIAVKVKLIAAAAIVVVGGALAYRVLHPREEPQAPVAIVPVARRMDAPKAPPTLPLAVANPVQAGPTFSDMASFLLAFRKAAEIAERGARWKEYQRIGISLQDGDLLRAEAEIPVKHGTREYFGAAFGNIMKAWLTADSRRVLDLFLGFPPERGMTQAECTKAILVNFAQFAPEAVLAYAKGLPDPDLARLIAPMTTSGAREAAVKADQLPQGEDRTQALEKALAEWANSDFRSASEWGETVLSREEWKSMMWHVLEVSGGRQNPRAASEVALRIFKDNELYNLGVEHLVKFWSESDPAAAGAFLLRLPVVENLRDPLCVRVATAWALRDPSAALIWAEQLPEREAALRAVGGALVKSIRADPVQALGLVQTLPERERRPAMEVIVAAWAELDPSAAAAVSRSFPGGPVGTDAIARAWAAKDLDAAKAWANTLAPEVRDAAMKAIERLRK